MNRNIIQQFSLLVNQVHSDYVDAQSQGDQKEIITQQFRLSSVKKALQALRKIDFEITSPNDIKGVPGLGKGSLTRIDEILKTGKLSEIKESINTKATAIRELSKVIGIGDKKAQKFVSTYDIKSIAELKDAYKNGVIKLDPKILLGLKYYGVVETNIPREEITAIKKYLIKIAEEIDDELEIDICGSYRRGTPISGDIDVIMFHPLMKTMDQTRNPLKYRLTDYIKSFVTVLTENGFILDHMTDKKFAVKYMGFCQYKKNPVRRIDIRIIPYDSMYPALLYFTGPADLNIQMRKEADKRDMLLNEYGLYKVDDVGARTLVKVTSEEDIFKKLGMEPLTPKERNAFADPMKRL